jgi:hypothetical protein
VQARKLQACAGRQAQRSTRAIVHSTGCQVIIVSTLLHGKDFTDYQVADTVLTLYSTRSKTYPAPPLLAVPLHKVTAREAGHVMVQQPTTRGSWHVTNDGYTYIYKGPY